MPLIGALGVIWAVARLALFGLVILLAACSLIEQPFRQIPRYDPDLHAGGWIPDIFPHDIVKIREQHDLDTNRIWLSFQLTDASYNPVAANYIELSPNERSSIKLTSPARPIWREEWWPKRIGPKSRVYRMNDRSETTYIMVTEKNEVYWWRV